MRLSERLTIRPRAARRADALAIVAILAVCFPWMYFELAGDHGPLLDVVQTLLRLVTTAITYAAVRAPLRRTSWWRAPRLHFMVVISVAVGGLLAMVADSFVLQLVGLYGRGPLGPWLSQVAHGHLWLIGVTPALMLCSAALLEHGISVSRRARERALRAERMVARQREARLNLLRLQLHPHFLFNALNSIAALLGTDRDAAVAMMDRLHGLFVRSLDSLARPLVSLSEELDWCREYLAVESVRFSDRLRIELHVAPEAQRACLPPLLLQPLVENAIRHGVARERGPATIEIAAAVDEAGTLRVLVANSSAASGPIVPGFGLRHSQRRLAETYAGRAWLSVKRRAGVVEARVELPQASRIGVEGPAA